MFGLLLKTQGFARKYGLAVAVVYLGMLLVVFGHHCGPQAHSSNGDCTSPDSRHYCGANFPDVAGHLCPVCTSQRHQSGVLLPPALPFSAAFRAVAAGAVLTSHYPRCVGRSQPSRGPPSC